MDNSRLFYNADNGNVVNVNASQCALMASGYKEVIWVSDLEASNPHDWFLIYVETGLRVEIADLT